MTYLDHDLGPEGPSRAPGGPVITQRTPANPATSPMLDLQRLAGNAAVSQAIKNGQFDSTPVQRLEEGATLDEDTDDVGDEELETGAEESAEEDETEDLATDLEEEEAEEEQQEDAAEESA